jgi:hydrogenase maturation protease
VGLAIKIIGVGNPFRGDDAAGRVAARTLRALALPGVTVLEATGEGGALMDAWADAETVFLIDAVQAQGEPGTVYRFDAGEERLPTHFFHYSTHTFSVAEAVELARTLGQLPPRLFVYGIEGAAYEAGDALSAPVEQAVARVVEQVRDEAARLMA